ncbi:hypothetical protein ATCC90586_010059 [Pythium insidiosum]|nr:hypothetical protein ATCC90586_010059 [Pythium insidiosum]
MHQELPAIGRRGVRLLDALRFPCVVIEAEGGVLAVEYEEDGTVERGVEPHEFELTDDKHAVARTVCSNPPRDRLLDKMPSPHHGQGDIEAIGSCVLEFVLPFLDHLSWLQTANLVSRSWSDVVLHPSGWTVLRLPSSVIVRGKTLGAPALMKMFLRVLDVRLAASRCRVGDVVRRLVANECDLIDEDVRQLILKCPQCRALELRGCSRVSFLLLYDLLRMTRERRAQLQMIDVWLCPGISPAFVMQLERNRSTRRALSDDPPTPRILGPGFHIVEVDVTSLEELRRQATPALQGEWVRSAQDWTWVEKRWLVGWLSRSEIPLQNHFGRARECISRFPLSVIPLIDLSPVLRRVGTTNYRFVGLPTTLSDLMRLATTHDTVETVACLQRVQRLYADSCDHSMGRSGESTAEQDNDDPNSLEARAARVFAQLRETTEQLQHQVAQLEHQVSVMSAARDGAAREYNAAQRELDRVAREADRALFSLATGSTSSPNTASRTSCETSLPLSPPTNGVVTIRPEDDTLPPLPSLSRVAALGRALETEHVAILDGFLGTELCERLRRDVETIYSQSRARKHARGPETPIDDEIRPPAPPTTLHFRPGELAGGNTGRNLRYQLAHVRGDYVLWLDETDAACPESVALTLRQLDRLVLERLARTNDELQDSALFRKKAMVTCYPGDSAARYTTHCDNPNLNGRKLTAILYLNAAWDSERDGGALRVKHRQHGERTIAPLLDRLLLFYSDQRVPHEVLPVQSSTRNRFALTVWYLDYDEFMNAQLFGEILQDPSKERARIQREQEGFRTVESDHQL